jgi:hypothetical protein
MLATIGRLDKEIGCASCVASASCGLRYNFSIDLEVYTKPATDRDTITKSTTIAIIDGK